MRISLIPLLGMILLSTGLEAKTYRWVDEHGEVHYGDQKPDVSYQTLDIAPENTPDRTPTRLAIEILPPPFRRPDPVIFLNEFRRLAPLPEWWVNSPLKPGTHYATRADLQALWLSEKRCCSKDEVLEANRRMFRAAYESILNYQGDVHALAYALTRLNLNYIDYPQQIVVQELALKYLFYYPQETDWCVCKPGDMIARQIYFLAQHYFRAGKSLAYAGLVEKFLDERSDETRVYAQAELFRQLAEAYIQAEQYRQAVQVLDKAITRLDTEYGSPAHLREVSAMKKRRDYLNQHYRRQP